ncbi:MAG: methylenetetrahydrofolate reductase, partial [Planctomycetota bacterium]
AKLMRALQRCGDDAEAVERVGIHWATEQCLELLDRGVRGIHFYTLNRSAATREIFRNLGLKTAASIR